jgi:hypothetical protein
MKLKVKFSTTTTGDQYLGYGIKAEVTEAEGITPNIFVFQTGVPELPTKRINDVFTNVASPTDIEETPEGAPDMSKKNPFYRRSSVTLWCRSAEWVEELRNDLDRDIRQLVNTYRVLNDENQYINQEEKTYG